MWFPGAGERHPERLHDIGNIVVLAPFSFSRTSSSLHTQQHAVCFSSRRPPQTKSTSGPWNRLHGMENTMGWLSGLANEDQQKQVQALTLCFSCETLSIVQNLGLSETESKKVDSIICTIKRCRWPC